MSESDKELFQKLETIIDESTEFFNFVPISSMVGILWANDEYKVPVVCTIGKAMMKLQIQGKSFPEIQSHFVDNLKIEHDFAANCYNSASIAGPYCADIMDGIISKEEAVEKVKEEFGENAYLAEPMIEALMSLVESGEDMGPPFIYEAPKEMLDPAPLKMDLHRQLAEFYFEEAQRPLASLIMALTQDYLDGTPIEELRSSLYKDLGPQSDGIIQNVQQVSESPKGVWVKVIDELKAFSA
ncbi:MAG: hypothetical protein NE328_08585 [Lentisphaeraceae bacterium]|nr:hypothetical protein [Lentisphaeraceae bacterium]